jgi:hypothetical protein
MQFRLIREFTRSATTFGVLFLDGHFFCFTLEDAIREVLGQPVEAWKIAGQTAIPAGTYALSLTPSQRFQTMLPLLDAVPGFTGIRIHSGNSLADTEGCILVGRKRGTTTVKESRLALADLLAAFGSTHTGHTMRVEPPAR